MLSRNTVRVVEVARDLSMLNNTIGYTPPGFVAKIASFHFIGKIYPYVYILYFKVYIYKGGFRLLV